MANTDVKKTILNIFNEVRTKLGLKTITTLTQDSQSTAMIEYLNDVVSEISDYGDWREQIREVIVTASTCVKNYVVDTSAVVKNIHEVAFQGRVAHLRYEDLDTIRRLERTSATGEPRQWTISGVDVSSANPIIRVYPTPGSVENNKTFDILYFQKPPLYTSSDASVIVPFPSALVVQGLLAQSLKDESRGTQTIDYRTEYGIFREMLNEVFNRLNGDTGSNTFFRPAYTRARR